MIKLAHWMPWTGDPSRVSHDTGYRQDDPVVIDAQVRCMRAAGLDGVVAWWQGPDHVFTHFAFTGMFNTCLKYGAPFIPALDPWVAKGTPDPTKAAIAALTSSAFAGMQPFFAERWVLEFDLANIGVDLAKVRAAVPGLTILSKHVGYSWPEVKPTLAETLALLKSDNANPQMRIPCVFSRFNDGGYPLPNGVGDPAHYNGQRDWNRSVWGGGPTRIIEEKAGQAYHDSTTLATDGSLVGFRYSGLATWNDYDEGTQHEPGYSRSTGIRIGT